MYIYIYFIFQLYLLKPLNQSSQKKKDKTKSVFFHLAVVIKVNDNYCCCTQTTSAVCIGLKPINLKKKMRNKSRC